ncbi:helix-turn-helix domain-containing protein [Aquibacillus sp. 3ASR75-11]|uniref:Helix-turn-helix domain-containing protein n=1 Tax=Terrihalobacillus insolitus TaxID=2950438 RepID=A0A9X3WRQ8_9BACI|nr:helix-turn-helix domain-containing protein [Terrihalobacillus insolitus]MDC3413085.1 helix-turn-helix domain-containing protein [Terrihalobacillus insolitus]MDC3424827.1 helix-turn-helix domain-containing protein [Terrihalobacillus insolitus]
MFELLVLQCLNKINQERTVYNIFHLLKGKRSSQTLQDAHIYKLKNYFGIYKNINKKTFHSCIDRLTKHGYLENGSSSTCVVTDKGKRKLEQNRDLVQRTPFRGMEYSNVAQILLERLLLFIQTTTNIVSGNHIFIPITDKSEVLRWVKRIYRKNKEMLPELLEKLYSELMLFCESLPDQEACIFVDQLTGYRKYGLSKEQLAMKYNLPLEDVELKRALIIHKLINHINRVCQTTDLLPFFIKDLQQPFFLTTSAQKTYTLLQKGFTIEQITTLRRLKESTVFDHIVEIALVDPTLPIDPYVSKEAIDNILEITDQLHTIKLKEIRQALENQYSYFQIRLALAIAKNHRRRDVL